MSATWPILAGAALVAAGIGALRFGWGRREGRLTAPIGWAAILLGLLVLAIAEGAWGLAIGGLTGSAAAFLLLVFAWARAPSGRAAPARAPTASLRLLEEGQLRIGRRLLTFLLVVPAAMAAAMLGGLAATRLGAAAGWDEGDSIAFGLFVFPVLWAALATWMMVRTGPAAMVKPLGGVAAAAGAILLAIAI